MHDESAENLDLWLEQLGALGLDEQTYEQQINAFEERRLDVDDEPGGAWVSSTDLEGLDVKVDIDSLG